jgi:hypothetical protein
MSPEVRGKTFALAVGLAVFVACLIAGLPKWPAVITPAVTVAMLMLALEFYWAGVNRQWIEASSLELQRLGFETTEDEGVSRAYEMETGKRRSSLRFLGCWFFAFGQIDGRPATVFFSSKDPFAGKGEARPDQAMAHITVWSQNLPAFRVGPTPGLMGRHIERGFKAKSGFSDESLEGNRYVYSGAVADVEHTLPTALLADAPQHEVWTCEAQRLICTWKKRASPDELRQMLSRMSEAAKDLPPAPEEPYEDPVADTVPPGPVPLP